jgi:hypothetical protein
MHVNYPALVWLNQGKDNHHIPCETVHFTAEFAAFMYKKLLLSIDRHVITGLISLAAVLLPVHLY